MARLDDVRKLAAGKELSDKPVQDLEETEEAVKALHTALSAIDEARERQ